MMFSKVLSVAAVAATAVSCVALPPTPVRESVPETNPEKTVRFPGGNYGGLALRDGLVVAASGWSREDGVGVFDVSGGKIEFLARFPARGYACAKPVFFGKRCYVPSCFSAVVLDVSDRRHPKFEGFLNPSFPKNGCDALWVEDGNLYFAAYDGVRKVGPDGFSSVKVDKKRSKDVNCRKATEGGVTAELGGYCLKTATATCPYVFNLATLAARGDTAWVFATETGNARLLPLDLATPGLKTFGPAVPVVDIAHTNGFMTMGMQTGGSVTRVGDLFFVDDGIFRLKKDGAFEKLRDRTASVANSSVDGSRIALAQARRCRVLDFADPAHATARDIAPKAEKPLHITGCVLDGNDLYLAYTLVEKPGQDFIYVFPTKGYVAHVDLAKGGAVDSTVEVPVCIALEKVGDMLYTTCRGGKFVLVDAAKPVALRVAGVRDDILDGDGYKIKRFGERVFVTTGHRVAELDVTNPATPQIKAFYAREAGTDAPGYDDFTVDGNRLYALAHCSVDVFTLGDPARTRTVANDSGVRGVDANAYAPADAAVFAGHVAQPTPPKGVTFRAGRYGNCFGASVCDWTKLADGRYAVAFGEGGLVVCNADGSFATEPMRDPAGYQVVFVAEVVAKDGAIYVRDREGKVYRVRVRGL